MTYVYLVLIGFCISIGFWIGKIMISILNEIIFERLHNSDRYKMICKRLDSNTKSDKEKPYTKQQ